jgi:hypothetical protein
MKIVSDLYNKVNYNVCAASGEEGLRIYESRKRMEVATEWMEPHTRAYCLGDDW